MKQAITDPNRSDRWAYFAVGGFIGALSLILPFTNPALPVVGLAALLGGLFIAGIGVLTRPYVVLDQKGITYRLPFRKNFCRWDEVAQVGIRNTKATKVPVEYLFPIVIVLPGLFKHVWLRDLFRTLLVPNRPEIQKYIGAYYGSLDFDDTDSLNNWQKQYYGFHKNQ